MKKCLLFTLLFLLSGVANSVAQNFTWTSGNGSFTVGSTPTTCDSARFQFTESNNRMYIALYHKSTGRTRIQIEIYSGNINSTIQQSFMLTEAIGTTPNTAFYRAFSGSPICGIEAGQSGTCTLTINKNAGTVSGTFNFGTKCNSITTNITQGAFSVSNPPAILVSPQVVYLISEINLNGGFSYSSFNNTVLVGEQLSKIEFRRSGIAADGVSKLLVAVESNVDVKFWIPSSTEDCGSLGKLASPNEGKKVDGITVKPFLASDGKMWAVAVYTAPNAIGGDGKERIVSVKYAPANQLSSVNSKDIKVVPPPVVFVHGMWSKPDAWKMYEKEIIDFTGRHCVSADYSYDNACTYDPDYWYSSSGILSVALSIKEALDFCADKKIECLQVDVIAHSAGTQMTRGFLRSFVNFLKYFNNYAYVKPIHRFITIGGVHHGSKLGTFLNAHKSHLLIWSIDSPFLLGRIGQMHVDFDPNSQALQNIGETIVPHHFIATHYYKNETTNGNGFRKIINSLISFVSNLNSVEEVFEGTNYNPNQPFFHDVIVPTESQTSGYINIGKKENYYTYFRGISHSGPAKLTQTNQVEIVHRIIELLKTNDLSLFGETIPSPVSGGISKRKSNQEITAKVPISHFIQSTTESIRITSPSTGSSFTFSTTTQITITISTNAETRLSTTGICFVGNFGAFEIPQNSPHTVTFMLPEDAPLGKVNIAVICKSTTNTILTDTTHFYISTTQQVVKLESRPSTLRLSPSFPSRPLYIQGYFGTTSSVSTATIFDVSDGSTGTTYATLSGGTVASVSSSGFVTMAGIGVDKVIISFGNVTTTVSVSIMPDLLSPTMGTIVQSTNISLQWMSMTGATYYTLQLSTNSEFTSSIVTFANLTVTTQTVTVASSSLYFWRVKAYSTTASTDWSNAWAFHTYIMPPRNITAVGTNAQVIVSWATSSSINVVGYELYRGVTSGIYTLLATTTATSFTDVNVTNCTWYYYSVKTIAMTDISPFSLEATAQPSIARIISTNFTTTSALWANSTTSISWTTDGCFDFIRILFSSDNGISWTIIGTTTNTGTYTWTVPEIVTSTALIKVVNSDFPDVATTSTIFSIRTMVSPIIRPTVYFQGLWNGTTHIPTPIAVELREGSAITNSTIVVRKTALLSTSGTAEVYFPSISSGDYWLVVRHGGHLPIAATTKITANTNATVSYNFTADSTLTAGNGAVIRNGNSFVVRSGDLDGNRTVQANDGIVYFVPNFGQFNPSGVPIASSMVPEDNIQSPTNATISVKVYLQGYWSTSAGRHIPSPVAVELRSGADISSSIGYKTRTAMISTSGVVTATFANITTGEYWLVLRHGAHIPVASALPILVTNATITYYDFTDSADKTAGVGATVLSGSVWLVRAGDLSGDMNVLANDGILLIIPNNGQFNPCGVPDE